MYDTSPGFVRVTKTADIKVTKVDDLSEGNFPWNKIHDIICI